MLVKYVKRFAVLLSVALSSVTNADIDVWIDEAGKQSRTFKLEGQPRLSDVLAGLDLSDQVCTRSAALYRDSVKAEQLQWKRSLLYDLEALRLLAERNGDPGLQSWAIDAASLIASQPVSGRVLDIVLSPYNLFPGSELNLPLKDEDRIAYYRCGTSMYVPAGAHLPFSSTTTISEYSALIPRDSWQAPGFLWIVYSNGAFRKAKVGYWQHEKEYAESRSWLFWPIKSGLLDEVNPNLNFELARWLATQVPSDE